MVTLDERAVNSILHQFTGNGSVSAALLLQTGVVKAHAGHLDPEQVAALADVIGIIDWPSLSASQVQVVDLTGHETSLLVYVRPVLADFDLALAAPVGSDLRQIRSLTDTLALRLNPMLRLQPDEGEEELVVLIDDPNLAKSAKNPYCLLWRTLVPLPDPLHSVLCQTLIRLAQANDTRIIHLSAHARFVQLIVECPTDRNSAWAAYQFKITLEQEIQKQADISTALWAKGYYATQNTAPLNNTELTLFLQHE